MKLLYVTYIDFGENKTSGSLMRPQKMYQAFLDLGFEVKLLECQQNKYFERRKKVKEVFHWLENNTPDVCYIESPSGPIFNQIDIELIKMIHRKNIPIGYFYRDAFWLFNNKMKSIPWFKQKIIIYLNKYLIRILEKNVDIVYLPSESVKELFNFCKFKNMHLLPPAADLNFEIDNNAFLEKRTCIYVGAVTEVDGIADLIEAFQLLNSNNMTIKLVIICRKKEWDVIKDQIIDNNKYPDWLKIVHASGNYLKQYYETADLAIIPRKKNKYIDISMPVKLFEYIGFGKPIISTPRIETARFIKQNECGIICEDNVASIAEAIEMFYNDKELRNNLYTNVKKVAEKNQWSNRAQKVIDDLEEIKGKI